MKDFTDMFNKMDESEQKATTDKLEKLFDGMSEAEKEIVLDEI